MTLSEWCKQANELPTHPTTEKGAVSVYANENTPNFKALWRLDDYTVSSRCGAVLWLIPNPGRA